MDTFIKYQHEAEERFKEYEEERWKKELEMEERRRQQYQEHEIRMMEMLGQIIQQINHYGYTGQYNYEDSTYHTDYYAKHSISIT